MRWAWLRRHGRGLPARAGVVLVAAALLSAAVHAETSDAAPQKRVVSLNPSLTAIILALGAGKTLVGVDDFSARQQPAVADRPLVGGLWNPSLEAVVALEPDLVVLVPSVEQRGFKNRLEALGIPVASFENLRFGQVLENIERMGRLVGKSQQAQGRVEEIQTARARLEALTWHGDRPATVVVLQRDPLFVVGSGSFIDEMLRLAGGRNVAAELKDPYPRVAIEWLVAAAPEVVVDMAPGASEAEAFWARWPSLPAVAKGRVRTLNPAFVTLPGPNLDRGMWALADAIHGETLTEALGESEASP